MKVKWSLFGYFLYRKTILFFNNFYTMILDFQKNWFHADSNLPKQKLNTTNCYYKVLKAPNYFSNAPDWLYPTRFITQIAEATIGFFLKRILLKNLQSKVIRNHFVAILSSLSLVEDLLFCQYFQAPLQSNFLC